MENSVANLGYFIGVPIMLLGLIYLSIVAIQVIKGKRTRQFTAKQVSTYFKGLLSLAPAFLAIWILPIALNNEDFLPLNSPEYYTFNPTVGFIILAITVFYLTTQFSIFFPHKNKYYNIIPALLVLTTLPGLANASLIMIINQFVNGSADVIYLVLLFAISTYVLILTTRVSSRKVAVLGNLVAHNLNIKIFKNVFKFSFRNYEKTASGKLYTVLNDDISTLFFFSQQLPGLYSSMVTIIVVSGYLWTISFTGSMLLLGTTVFIMLFQNFFTGSMRSAWLTARKTRENFTDVVTGLVNGFKELIIHRVKRTAYLNDLEKGSATFYKTHREAMYVDIDKTIFANFAFTLAIGVSCLIFPIVLNLDKNLVTTFVITMLYLWGPMGAIITAIPSIMRVQVSRQRINDFIKDMNATSTSDNGSTTVHLPKIVEKLEANNVSFTYDLNDEESHTVGPINIEANNGEVTFIIGGNGSGKTTMLKVLAGLYEAQSGNIFINGERVDAQQLGEYFSIIHSDFYLFKKIYGIKPEKLDQVNEWLDILGLTGKVKIENGAFSTIDLSKGQRKRLSIIRSYLEDRPINIYDECAADLDPEFKEFFYNVLLPKMKNENKVVIIISHDDRYFNSADRIYKMDMGKSLLLKSPEVYAHESNGVPVI